VSGGRALSASRLLTAEPPMPMTKAARASAPSTPTTTDLLQTGSRQDEAPASERSHKHLPDSDVGGGCQARGGGAQSQPSCFSDSGSLSSTLTSCCSVLVPPPSTKIYPHSSYSSASTSSAGMQVSFWNLEFIFISAPDVHGASRWRLCRFHCRSNPVRRQMNKKSR
jgi:hypothetical protein